MIRFSESLPATDLFLWIPRMYDNKNPRIRVYPLRESPSHYVATFHSNVLLAIFSVNFRETITGAVGLHTFAEMIRKQYGCAFEMAIMDGFGLPSNSPVRDVLKSLEKPIPIKLVS